MARPALRRGPRRVFAAGGFSQALRLATRAGFTHFLPYLENMIRLRPQRRACPPCAYTPAQWKTFEHTARNARIVLVPHFNVIGQSAAAWDRFPAHRRLLVAQLAGDVAADRASFRRYQFPRGPIFDNLGRSALPQFPAPRTARWRNEFSLTVGTAIRFCRADETFVVYPQYGGTLQDGRRGGVQLIEHNAPAAVKRGLLPPGGYNRYRGIGGLRIIWAVGVHQNPNCLWQHAYDWKIMRDDAQRKVVRLTQKLPHVEKF